jgi:5-methylcytosine-specific restriction endonuclease McrA
MTQAEIAEACDVHVSTIRKWMKKLDIETRDPVGENHPMYGKTRDKETKQKISESMTGREFTEEWKRKISEANSGQQVSDDRRQKISKALSGRELSEETKRRMSESTAGKANPNWRGGHDHRYGAGWSRARRFVQNRDEDCIHCGEDGSSRRLHVHHIVPVRGYRQSDEYKLEEAHDPRNLVLLCSECHVRADHGIIQVDHSLDDAPALE